MDLAALIDGLSDPRVYPGPVEAVEVRQTHISVVFLAGAHVYKIKKPVDLGFLDFSTLDKRCHFCAEEIRLNRRLASAVYECVVPITREGASLKVEGRGEPIEWAVKMVRLPDEATLSSRLHRGEIDASRMEELARHVASFHASADSNETIAAFGRFDVVAENARENLSQSADHVGVTLSGTVFARLHELLESSLARLRPLIEKRASSGVPRDTHGDLRLDHVYLFPEKQPPDDFLVIECIEFNERFRYADPVADMAFLVMDLLSRGRSDLAQAFASAYFEAAGDPEGRELLPFYVAYRAAVRAKVGGMKLSEREVPQAERIAARDRARACWLTALAQLGQPNDRPCLVIVGGLPGAGKSTLAQDMAERSGFSVIRSDVVRKELVGCATDNLYSTEWTEKTYAECLCWAEQTLFEGGRPLVDASFREEAQRQAFLALAERWGVPALFLYCRANPEITRTRLAGRKGDASDADWDVYLHLAEIWEQLSPTTRKATVEIATDRGREQALADALWALLQRGLYDVDTDSVRN